MTTIQYWFGSTSNKKDDAMKQMTPSRKSITDGQIGKINENLSAMLRKRRNELPANIVQYLLEEEVDETLTAKLFNRLRIEVELLSNIIYRYVKVSRRLSPQEMLNATKRNVIIDYEGIDLLPKGEGAEVEIVLFSVPGKDLTEEELEDEYATRNLRPVDPYSLAALNENDPEFADRHPNCTHWKDQNGAWCSIFFQWCDNERSIHLYRPDSPGHKYLGVYETEDVGEYIEYDDWWFAGIRK
jgi:hypothetical protein